MCLNERWWSRCFLSLSLYRRHRVVMHELNHSSSSASSPSPPTSGDSCCDNIWKEKNNKIVLNLTDNKLPINSLQSKTSFDYESCPICSIIHRIQRSGRLVSLSQWTDHRLALTVASSVIWLLLLLLDR